MRSSGEEIEGLYSFDLVFFEEKFDVAGLGGGITREVDDGFWSDFV